MGYAKKAHAKSMRKEEKKQTQKCLNIKTIGT
jgi:hypothetical protein